MAAGCTFADELDPSLLQQLTDEMLVGRVDQLTMGIRWVAGLAKEWSPGKTLWLYKPFIQGHVTTCDLG